MRAPSSSHQDSRERYAILNKYLEITQIPGAALLTRRRRSDSSSRASNVYMKEFPELRKSSNRVESVIATYACALCRRDGYTHFAKRSAWRSLPAMTQPQLITSSKVEVQQSDMPRQQILRSQPLNPADHRHSRRERF